MIRSCFATDQQHSTAPSADELRAAILHTQISPAVAWTMIIVFLSVIFSVPLCQVVVELRRGERPGLLDLFTAGRFPTRADLRQYQDALQERSCAVRYCQPHVQKWLTSWDGCGTAQVVLGRDGWLFYRPGIDAVTGPGFLDPRALRRRVRNWRDAAATETVVPDPRAAIREFQQQIHAAGAQLVLVPIPDKASLQAAQLCGINRAISSVQNPSYADFLRDMRAAGVEVFDPSPAVVRPEDIRYLAQDTHWTPQWMAQVARELAVAVRPHLTATAPTMLRVSSESVSNIGDLAEALRLPDRQPLFAPQTVTIQRIVDASGRPVRAQAGAQVLLLGDSFTNIYSARQMGWGDGAGLAEHLAYQLQQPIDWIARNDAGAYATREMLSSQLSQGRNRLAGKRVVIWQFAARELAWGDWRSVPLPRQSDSPGSDLSFLRPGLQ